MPAECCPVCGVTKMIRTSDKASFFTRHLAAKKMANNGVFVICDECMRPIGVRARVRVRNRETAKPSLKQLKDGDEGSVVAINGDSRASARTRVPKTRYDVEQTADQIEVEFNIPSRLTGKVMLARAQLERLSA